MPPPADRPSLPPLEKAVRLHQLARHAEAVAERHQAPGLLPVAAYLRQRAEALARDVLDKPLPPPARPAGRDRPPAPWIEGVMTIGLFLALAAALAGAKLA